MQQQQHEIQVQDVTEKLILVGVDVTCLSGTISRDDRGDDIDKEVFTAGSVRYIVVV